MDASIVLDAIYGYDAQDSKSFKSNNQKGGAVNYTKFKFASLRGKTFGAFKGLLEDSLYVKAIADLKSQGATIIEFEPKDYQLPDFLRLLNLDMKKDLPEYFSKYGDPSLDLKSVEDVMVFNLKDSINSMPYGQSLFEGIVADKATNEEFLEIKKQLKINGSLYFYFAKKQHNLDAFLSINNYHAGFAAVAEIPAITIPMGYTTTGEPKGLTIIGDSEKEILEYAYLYEQASKKRVAPLKYD